MLVDDHDVQSFLTHSLTPPADGDHTDSPVTAEEKKKFEKEFDEYWDKLQKAKETLVVIVLTISFRLMYSCWVVKIVT